MRSTASRDRTSMRRPPCGTAAGGAGQVDPGTCSDDNSNWSSSRHSATQTAHIYRQLLEIFKGKSFSCSPGAPYAWLELPPHWIPARFNQALMAKKVKVTPGNAFNLDAGSPSRHVRVCFGHPGNTRQAHFAFQTLADLMGDREEEDFTPVA